MKQFFKNLFEYNHHFNQKFAGVFTDNADKTSEKAIKLFNHLLNAHQIWNNRIEPKQTTFGVWELHEVRDLKCIDKENFELALQILARCDLNETITYQKQQRKSIQQHYFGHFISRY